MNLFFREMKANRKSLIFWSIGFLLMVVLGMNKYEAAAAGGQSMGTLIGNMPKALQTLFGVGTLDVGTVIGYYGMLFIYLLLMAGIHSVMLGANIIAKEERDKTAEFLLVKPISRNRIITTKLFVVLLNILIVNMVTLVSSIWACSWVNKGNPPNKQLILLMVGMFLFQIIFMAIGSGMASMSKKPKKAAMKGTMIFLLSYLIYVFVGLYDKVDVLKYFSPFKYFDASYIIPNQCLKPVYVLLSVIILAVFISITYVFYNKRDLNV